MKALTRSMCRLVHRISTYSKGYETYLYHFKKQLAILGRSKLRSNNDGSKSYSTKSFTLLTCGLSL